MTEPTITDEGVERLQARVGVAEPWTRRPHYLRPNTDAFRIVAESYGDDNPLWGDPEYAAKSVWGGPLAPPPLVGGDSLIGEDEVTAVPDDKRDLMKGYPLRGVHAFYSASAREWWAPLRPDRRVWRRNAMVAVLDKSSEFAGRAVHEWSANVFRDDEGTVLSGQYRLMIRTERKKAREKKKYDAIEPAHWTEEQNAELDAEYAAYRRRGAEPRCWEDVDEGNVVGPLVKGPMLVTDMVCWHVGMGMGLYDVKPLALGVANRRRIPRFFHLDDQGIPDVMQRVHWDPEWARNAGNPTTYDYGRMRETWLIHLCTDWMGDDAWLWKLECSFRGFNYVGDVHHLTGTIVRKYLAEGDRPAVDLELAATNQRGVVTTPGTATILLPSRDHGPVRLPDPPGAGLETSLVAIGEAFGGALMPLCIVVALDDEDHPVARRDALRSQHLDYVLADDRAIQFVGPMRRDDDGAICGSIYVFEAPSAAHVQRWLDDEPYHLGGVYRDVLIRPFEVRKNQLPHRALPTTDAHPASGDSSSTTRRTSGKSMNAE